MKRVNDITSGSIPRTILSLAVPVVLGMLMQTALHITDFFWVGKLGATAQDAITSSMVVTWTVWSLISLISVGVTAIVARYVGARDSVTAAHYARQGLLMATGIGGLLGVVGYIATPALLRFMGTGSATMAMATPYLRIAFLYGPLFFVSDAVFATFRASGDTRTPTVIGIIYVLVNMVLDPILIFGVGPIPALGVPGAGLATGVAAVVGVVLAFHQLLGGKLGFSMDLEGNLRPRLRDMVKIGRIGMPMASQQMVFVIVYWFLIKIVHVYGETAGAAMGIGNRMESISYLTCYGFSVAASTMVGQNLGALRPDRAARCAWGAIGMSISITIVTSALFIAIPEFIATVFTDDPEVLAIAVDYLIILGLSQVTMAVEIVLEGAFGGAGDTVPPMLVSVPGALARIPLAYLLCFTLDWGITGVWWTLTITTTIKAAFLAAWFSRGRWKLKKV